MSIDFFCRSDRLRLATSIVIAIAAGLGWPLSAAQALTFNFGFAEGTSQDVVEGFNRAGELWSALLVDDVMVNIDVQFAVLGSSALGQFSPTRSSVTYQSFRTQLWNDVTSPDDAIAVGHLSRSPAFDLLLDPTFDLLINRTENNPSGIGSSEPYLDNDSSRNNRTIRLTTANAKALGLVTDQTQNDGQITLNSLFPWDFDDSDGIDSDKFDFVGVAAQGIGTILGFISGVDVLDFNSPLIQGNQLIFFRDDDFRFVSPVDLFRFSEESRDLGVIDWTTGRTNAEGVEVDKYFSIDGGTTKIASFSTGVRHGDGRRASSWKSDEFTGENLGLMSPVPSLGQLLEFSTNDQRLFDVIGWDLANPLLEPPSRNLSPDPVDGELPDPVLVPEPSFAPSLMAMTVGAGWLLTRKRFFQKH